MIETNVYVKKNVGADVRQYCATINNKEVALSEEKFKDFLSFCRKMIEYNKIQSKTTITSISITNVKRNNYFITSTEKA